MGVHNVVNVVSKFVYVQCNGQSQVYPLEINIAIETGQIIIDAPIKNGYFP